jgi:hypothetical protein
MTFMGGPAADVLETDRAPVLHDLQLGVVADPTRLRLTPQCSSGVSPGWCERWCALGSARGARRQRGDGGHHGTVAAALRRQRS